jgi:hypothetical protein
MFPESQEPSVAVTVWLCWPLLTHFTVVPGETRAVSGKNEPSVMDMVLACGAAVLSAGGLGMGEYPAV